MMMRYVEVKGEAQTEDETVESSDQWQERTIGS